MAKAKETKRKAERCRVCKKKILVMCFKGTGFCCQKCQKESQDG